MYNKTSPETATAGSRAASPYTGSGVAMEAPAQRFSINTAQMKGPEEELPVQHKSAEEELPMQHKGMEEDKLPMQHKSPEEDLPMQHKSPEEEMPMQHKSADELPMQHKSPEEDLPMQHKSPEEEMPMQHKSAEELPMQHKSPEEDKLPVQGRFVLQRNIAMPEEQAPVQGKFLPAPLQSGIEQLSGMDMSGVNVHYNSEKPAQLNALAYAQGNNIHVGPGQEKHLPHEAWHVVQQRQGRVQATTQLKQGVPVNDDPGLEKEADVMGAKALSIPAVSQHD